jgi:Uma2 family endonuclease
MSTARAMTYEQPSPRPATQADIDALPPHMTGQIIDGVLYAHARPARRHANAHTELTAFVRGRFRAGRGGPGVWYFLAEPELHLHGNVLVPDIAGWRSDKLPATDGQPHFTTPPDWVCEVLSPSTARFDRWNKSLVYARHGVGHMWIVDPDRRELEVWRLMQGFYARVQFAAGDESIRAEPFDELELNLSELWEGPEDTVSVEAAPAPDEAK